MAYAVKEIYYTLQGEGYHTGRPAVFCRFSGCNLWSGREADRHKAICQFCDTDFWGTDGTNGGKYKSAEDLAEAIRSLWPGSSGSHPFVVCTGGEPALQLDDSLISAFLDSGFEIAVETNGTIALAEGIHWICMSPKAGTDAVVTEGDELKLVYPQADLPPEIFEDWDFDHFYLQPMDGPHLQENTRSAIEYCKNHPHWKLSIQTHKYLNIP